MANFLKTNEVQIATFAAGCFWSVEEAFRARKGVIATTVGYTGGTLINPTYKDVCAGKTGHAETVRIEYGPEKISYQELLDIFWGIHDPTTYNRQGPDIGAQYRSAIFFHTPGQETLAQQSKTKQEKSGKFKNAIVTEITRAGPFYKAEEYHQQYLHKRGKAACHI